MGAAPGALLPGAHEVQHRAGQALPVDPGVLEEPVVLAREECMDEPLGDLVEAQRCAALLAELGEQLAIAGVDAQGDLEMYVAEDFGGRKLRRQVQVAPAGGDAQGEHRQQHKGAESLECAGESNHGLCSARTRGRSNVDRVPRGGFDRQRGDYTPVGGWGTTIGPFTHPRRVRRRWPWSRVYRRIYT